MVVMDIGAGARPLLFVVARQKSEAGELVYEKAGLIQFIGAGLLLLKPCSCGLRGLDPSSVVIVTSDKSI
jgi:hypothetical protein